MKSRIILSFILLSFSTSCFSFDQTPANEPDVIPISISGTFDVTTNYLSEGLSNTNNAPAIQGGLTYTFKKSGIYFNAWGTNADFTGFRNQHITAELDAIAGVANDINNNWSYNVYLDQYIYPGAPVNNYLQLVTNVTYKIFTFTTYYSGNVYGSHSTGIYLKGTINYEIPENFIKFSNISALASVAHYDLSKKAGINSYYDFMLGIQKKIKQFTLTLQWTDTANSNYHPYDGYHIVGTVLYKF